MKSDWVQSSGSIKGTERPLGKAAWRGRVDWAATNSGSGMRKDGEQAWEAAAAGP